MPTSRFTTFTTPLGVMGIAWSESVVTRVALPDTDRDAVRARLRRGLAGVHADADTPMEEVEATGWAGEVTRAVQRHLAGDLIDLAWVDVDLSALAPAARAVYTATRRISPGQTMTYGELAAAVGQPGAAQAVGRAMGRNPVPLIVPCHRVVGADGALVGFSSPGGVGTKRRLLELEMAAVVAQRTLF